MWENKYQLRNIRLQIFHKWHYMWWVSIISLTTYWHIIYFTSSLFFQYHHQCILLSLLITLSPILTTSLTFPFSSNPISPLFPSSLHVFTCQCSWRYFAVVLYRCSSNSYGHGVTWLQWKWQPRWACLLLLLQLSLFWFRP